MEHCNKGNHNWYPVRLLLSTDEGNETDRHYVYEVCKDCLVFQLSPSEWKS